MNRGFTLIELMIVMVIIGIAFGLALPFIGDSKELRLREAARMLAADLEFAQSESIAHPDNLRIVKFNSSTSEYWITSVSASPTDTPITDPARNTPFLVQFGIGRAEGIGGVTIASYSLGGDNAICFDAYGAPDQTTTASITLACGPETVTVQIAPGSGEISIP